MDRQEQLAREVEEALVPSTHIYHSEAPLDVLRQRGVVITLCQLMVHRGFATGGYSTYTVTCEVCLAIHGNWSPYDRQSLGIG